MSYIFDGVDDRIQLAGAPSTAPTQVTMIAWIKPTAFSSRSTILAHYQDSNDLFHGLYAYVGSSTGKLRFRAPWTTSPGVWETPDNSITPNVWTGVAATYNAGSSSNDAILYLKPEGGSISAATVTEVNAPSGSFNSAMDNFWAGGVYGSYGFTGRIAYVREFTSILTQAQIDTELSSAAAVLTAALDLPLVADANDDSGNGHNGTVSGATLDANNPSLGGTVNNLFQRRMRRFFVGV
jgi:hypothetical protein